MDGLFLWCCITTLFVFLFFGMWVLTYEAMNKLLIAASFFMCLDSFASTFQQRLVSAAIERTKLDITYNGAYLPIEYPNGDVPENVGVCTDVIIRSYRALGVDLQVLVHEDMSRNFDVYPSRRIWGLNVTDTNIDHRRVPNLQTFLSRYGTVLNVTDKARDYEPGDIVTWLLPHNRPHIGIVSDRFSNNTGNPLIVHNINSGPSLDDMLFSYKVTGHYRFTP